MSETSQTHPGRRFHAVERLRSPERVARLEVERVVNLALAGAAMHSVLDIGAGSAIFAEAFARQGLATAGVDANPAMLQAARGYLPGGDFRLATAEALPFADASVDLAFMGLVLHETDDPLKAMQEARRVCRVRLVVLEWPYEPQDFGPGMEERLSPQTLADLASQAGFRGCQATRLEHLALYRCEL